MTLEQLAEVDQKATTTLKKARKVVSSAEKNLVDQLLVVMERHIPPLRKAFQLGDDDYTVEVEDVRAAPSILDDKVAQLHRQMVEGAKARRGKMQGGLGGRGMADRMQLLICRVMGIDESREETRRLYEARRLYKSFHDGFRNKGNLCEMLTEPDNSTLLLCDGTEVEMSNSKKTALDELQELFVAKDKRIAVCEAACDGTRSTRKRKVDEVDEEAEEVEEAKHAKHAKHRCDRGKATGAFVY